MNLQKRMGGLKDKIPDIQKTLDSVKFLKLRKVCFSSASTSCAKGYFCQEPAFF